MLVIFIGVSYSVVTIWYFVDWRSNREVLLYSNLPLEINARVFYFILIAVLKLMYIFPNIRKFVGS